MDKMYGRWLLKNRLNVDKVLLPFVVEQDMTCEVLYSKQASLDFPTRV